MSVLKTILLFIGIIILGALGALLFNLFILPYLLVNPYFEKFEFVKDFKAGKIVINPKETVYIQETTAIEQALERLQKSVVSIQSSSLGLKSGFIATSDGNIITLASAIPLNGNFKVFLQGQSTNFKVIKIDVKNNLALLKIDPSSIDSSSKDYYLQTVGFASLEKIKLGQRVFFVAPTSSLQDNWFVNEGIIKQIHLGQPQIIKTNILEKPIVNGSPLFNLSGELVGLNFIDLEGNISAVSVESIKEFLGL